MFKHSLNLLSDKTSSGSCVLILSSIQCLSQPVLLVCLLRKKQQKIRFFSLKHVVKHFKKRKKERKSG